jgi:hypothetical protein
MSAPGIFYHFSMRFAGLAAWQKENGFNKKRL